MRLKMLGAIGVILLAAACSNTAADRPDAAATGVVAPGTIAEFQQRVGDRVFFDLDSSQLRPDSRDTLNKQAAWLKQYSNFAVTIEGHADERGTREYNLALGARRAQTIASYLAAQGLPAGRARTISYGKERPEVVGSDEGAWSRNRRGVTALQ